MANLSRLIALAFGLLLAVASWACVIPEAYEKNEDNPGSFYWGSGSPATWATNFASGCYSDDNPSGGPYPAWPIGYPYGTNYARVDACVYAALTYYWSVQSTPRTIARVGGPSGVGTSSVCQTYSRSGTTNSSYCITRSSLSWPPEYTHEQCTSCTAGDSYVVSAIAESEAQAVTAFNNTCENGCVVTAHSINDFWLPSSTEPGQKWGMLKLRETGAECSNEPPVPPTETPPPAEPVPESSIPAENCVTSSAGVEYCDSASYGENCGYVNDKFTCLGKTDPDECWINDDGSRICGDSAPTPPVPDSGTAGVKATPTDTVSHTGPSGAQNTYNYYNSATVTASSRDPGTSGANPGRSDSTDPKTATTPTAEQGGGGDGVGDGTGASASGGASCDEPPVCDGDPVGCGILAQQWRLRCDTTTVEDVLTAMEATEDERAGNLGLGEVSIGELDADGGFSSSACPAPISVSVMGQTISMDVWQRGCDMALLFAPFVLAMGYLAGGMLFMKGGI